MGFYNGNYVTEAGVKSSFANVGQVLNLKENQVPNQIESVPVTYFAKIYNFSMHQEGKL